MVRLCFRVSYVRLQFREKANLHPANRRPPNDGARSAALAVPQKVCPTIILSLISCRVWAK